jgi:tRNA(Ile)-lysidine synthase
MTQLLDRVRRFVREHDLAGPETRVVVALSGGSDSVALAHIVRELDAATNLRAVGFAHFNHQLRPAADDDERFCARFAEAFEWPMCVEREDIYARARRERRSIEHAARAARYEFFERARTRLGADVVALGHTRDDQAETFLLRLVRGAGLRGLAAMHPRNGAIVRPLLTCRRVELRAYLAARHVGFVEDESNADLSIPRNRVRGELLPLLESRFNPRIVDTLANEAELAQETWQWLEAEAEALMGACSQPPEPGAGPRDRLFDVAALKATQPVLRRLLIWRAMNMAAADRPVSFEHVQAVLHLIASDKSASIDAPGLRVERVGARLVLRGRPERTIGRPTPGRGRTLRNRPLGSNLFEYSLSIPGEVAVPLAGCAISAETTGGEAVDPRALSSNPTVAVVRRDLCGQRLRVRNRRPGDRFKPIGLGGRKKLQDFFVDRKVARQRRDTVPLVVDEDGRIVWVAGYGIDEAFRITDSAQAVLILRLKLLGGPA